MSEKSLTEFVAAYIERYSKQFEWSADLLLQEQDLNFWAVEEFSRLTRAAPEDAWRAILAIVEATEDKYTLENLSAGPLEDLLKHHGPQFIERIEERASLDPKFKELLGGVWECSTPEVWSRVTKAQGAHIEPDA